MKPIFLVILAAFLFSINLSAQTITGKVVDTENQPIEFANVALYSFPDSGMISGTITDRQGQFSLSRNGTKDAFLQISFIGYETQTVKAEVSQTIILKNDSKLLDEVTVEGNLPRIEIKTTRWLPPFKTRC